MEQTGACLRTHEQSVLALKIFKTVKNNCLKILATRQDIDF